MKTYAMTRDQIQAYAESLRMEERSESTVRKYANALAALYGRLPEDKSVTKERLLAWKADISGQYGQRDDFGGQRLFRVPVVGRPAGQTDKDATPDLPRHEPGTDESGIYALAERGAGHGQSAPVLPYADAWLDGHSRLRTALCHRGGVADGKRDREL